MDSINWNVKRSSRLIFVGIEMRQTQQVALAAQQQQRASALLDIIGSTLNRSPISWLDFVSENFDVSDEKIALGENAAYQLWMVYENDHLQYESPMEWIRQCDTSLIDANFKQ